VIQSFNALVAERAARVVAEAVALCSLRGPAPAMENKPHKETTLVRRFGLPEFFSAQHLRLAGEHGGVRRGGRIHTGRRPTPDEAIVHLLQNDDGLKPFTKLHILH
jgi:hypothetical protein